VSILVASLIIIICLAAAAFFSGAETALVCADRIRLRHLVEKGNKRALIVESLLNSPQKFLGTTLVGTNLAIVGGSVVATKLAGQILGSSTNLGVLLQTVVMTLLVLVFAEIVPKNLSRIHADLLVLLLAPGVKISYLLLSPVVLAATGLSHLLFKREPCAKDRKIPFVSREELRFLTSESHRYGLIEKQEQFIVHQIFDFAETTVQEVMVPLDKVVAADLKSSPPQIVEMIQKEGFSRILIYSGDVNNILGVVDINHLLGARRNTPLKKLIYPLSRVKQETSIEWLFLQLQRKREHMALVMGERGRVIGIVTMEDLLEEIVGDIKDEHDEG
jgi:CBS domain containing-hemolysin-like protein